MLDKQDILTTAKRLFNTYGYDNTSMRDISKELNISVGNLTYHFKKKEDILNELCKEDFYKDRKEYDENITFSQLDEFLYKMMEVVIHYRFYFCDPKLTEIVQKDIQDLTNQRIETVMHAFEKYLVYLQNNGRLQFDESMSHIIGQVFMYAHIGWIQIGASLDISHMMYMQWKVLQGYVSDTYRDEYFEVLQRYQAQ